MAAPHVPEPGTPRWREESEKEHLRERERDAERECEEQERQLRRPKE